MNAPIFESHEELVCNFCGRADEPEPSHSKLPKVQYACAKCFELFRELFRPTPPKEVVEIAKVEKLLDVLNLALVSALRRFVHALGIPVDKRGALYEQFIRYLCESLALHEPGLREFVRQDDEELFIRYFLMRS